MNQGLPSKVLNIVFHPFIFEKKEWIGILFGSDLQIAKIIRQVKGVRWCEDQQCWCIPLNRVACRVTYKLLSVYGRINLEELTTYLERRKRAFVGVDCSRPGARNVRIPVAAIRVSSSNLDQLQKFVEQLKLRAYSNSTIRTYRNEFLQLLQSLKNKRVEDLTPDDLKRYMIYAMESEGIKENTAHSRLNALKFYYEQVLKREKFFYEIPRPKRPQQLPKLLNENEITRLFNALTNKKHKAMLFTIYSAGLRVSELVRLKIADIDSKRMQIFVERAKGKKDRYVNLSPVLLDILRKYFQEYKPRPKEYLFESEQTLTSYPARTVQQIFSNAKAKAGIRKEVGIHSLRHSFATHLLDKGTDIRYIKDLLGHFNIKTTERYLHVTKKQLVNVVSPFDDLWRNNRIAW